MSSWRSIGLAVWALCAVALSGCSSTSLPGRFVRIATGQVGPAQNIPFDRLVTVGQTFEAQGKYTEAQRMYNLVLSKQPNNVHAAQSMRRLAALRSSNGRVFDGAQQYQQSAPPTQMMAAAQHQTPTIQMVSATSAAPVPQTKRRKSVSTLTAASTVPFRTKARPQSQPASNEEFAAPIIRQVANEVRQDQAPLPPEEWTLPRVAPAPSFQHPETGRVRLENTHVAAAPVQAAPATAITAPPAMTAAAPINIESCLDNPALHVGKLQQALTSADPDTRSLAAFLLGEAGQEAASALPVLKLRLTAENDESLRVTIAESVAKLDSSDVQARTVLLSGLRSSNTAIRSQAAFGLRVFAAAADKTPTLEALTSALADSDADVVAMAALSLSDFGTNGKSALPGLEAAKTGASKEVQDALDAAITRING